MPNATYTFYGKIIAVAGGESTVALSQLTGDPRDTDPVFVLYLEDAQSLEKIDQETKSTGYFYNVGPVQDALFKNPQLTDLPQSEVPPNVWQPQIKEGIQTYVVALDQDQYKNYKITESDNHVYVFVMFKSRALQYDFKNNVLRITKSNPDVKALSLGQYLHDINAENNIFNTNLGQGGLNTADSMGLGKTYRNPAQQEAIDEAALSQLTKDNVLLVNDGPAGTTDAVLNATLIDELEPIVIPIPLPWDGDSEENDEYLRIGYTTISVPPTAIRFSRTLVSESIPILRNNGSLKRVSGPSPEQVEIVFSCQDPETINEVLIPLVNQFRRIPFLPVVNSKLNDLNITALTLESLAVSTIEGIPNALSVTLTCQPFEWDFYLEGHEGSFGDAFCWPLFKLWCETRSRAIPLTGPMDGRVVFYTPKSSVIKDIEANDKTVIVPGSVASDASLAKAILQNNNQDILSGIPTLDFTRPGGPVATPEGGALGYLAEDGTVRVFVNFLDAQNILYTLQENAGPVYQNQPQTTRVNGQGYSIISPGSIPLTATQAKAVAKNIEDTLLGKGSIKYDDLWFDLPQAWSGFLLLSRGVETYTQGQKAASRTIDTLSLDDFDEYLPQDSLLFTSVTASLSNQITSLPVQMRSRPVHQYAGGSDTFFSLGGVAEGMSELRKLRDLFEQVATLAREFRGAPDGIEYGGFLRIENEIFGLLGVTHVLPLHFEVTNVEGVPNHFNFSMDFVSFDPAQRKIETLNRLESQLNTRLENLYGDKNWYQKASDDNRHRLVRYQFFEQRLRLLELYPDMQLPTYEELNRWIKALKGYDPKSKTFTKNSKDTLAISFAYLLAEFFTDTFTPNGTYTALFSHLETGQNNFGFVEPDFFCISSLAEKFFVPGKTNSLAIIKGDQEVKRFPGIKELGRVKMDDMLDALLGEKDNKKPAGLGTNKTLGSNKAIIMDATGTALEIDPNSEFPDSAPGKYEASAKKAGGPANLKQVQEQLEILSKFQAEEAPAPQVSSVITSLNAPNISKLAQAVFDAKRGLLPNIIKRYSKNIDNALAAYPKSPGVDRALIAAIISIESEGINTNVNNLGYSGLMQINPRTAATINWRDPQANINAGVSILFGMIKNYKDLPYALLGYQGSKGSTIKSAQIAGIQKDGLFSSAVKNGSQQYVAGALALAQYLRDHPTGIPESLTQAEIEIQKQNQESIGRGIVNSDQALSSAKPSTTANADPKDPKITNAINAAASKNNILPSTLRALLYYSVDRNEVLKKIDTLYGGNTKRYGLMLLPGEANAYNFPDCFNLAAALLAKTPTDALDPGSATPGQDAEVNRLINYLYSRDELFNLAGLQSVYKPKGPDFNLADTPFTIIVKAVQSAFTLSVNPGDQQTLKNQEAQASLDPKITRTPAYENNLRENFHDMIEYNQEHRLVRAFPTYCVLVIDEGRWIGVQRLWDHLYGGFGIVSIETTQSRESPVDVCQIAFSNLYGNLSSLISELASERESDTRLQWSLDAVYQGAKQVFSGQVNDDLAARWSRHLTSLMLKPGARLHVRLGYGSDASSMPVRFNGTISELPVSDKVIQVIALGDGSELGNEIPQEDLTDDPVGKTPGDHKFYLDIGYGSQGREPREIIQKFFTPSSKIGAIITGGQFFSDNPYGISHFGDVNYNYTASIGTDEIGINIYDSSVGAHRNTDGWNNFVGAGNLVAWRRGQDVLIGVRQEGGSPWDVIETCRLAVHDYVCAVRPFQLRSTLFFGRTNYPFHYRYTMNGVPNVPRAQSWKDIELIMDSKPFSQMHFAASRINLIKSDISASAETVYNNVQAVGSFGAILGDNIPELLSNNMQADSDIYPERQKRLVFETGVYTTTLTDIGGASNIAQTAGGILGSPMANPVLNNVATQKLRDSVATMYQGQLLLLGDPSINAWDYLYINDEYLKLSGMAQVRSVVHHYSLGMGFQTVVTPDALVFSSQTDQANAVLVMQKVIARLISVRVSSGVGATILRTYTKSEGAIALSKKAKDLSARLLANKEKLKETELYKKYQKEIDAFITDGGVGDTLLSKLKGVKRPVITQTEDSALKDTVDAYEAGVKAAMESRGLEAGKAEKTAGFLRKSLRRLTVAPKPRTLSDGSHVYSHLALQPGDLPFLERLLVLKKLDGVNKALKAGDESVKVTTALEGEAAKLIAQAEKLRGESSLLKLATTVRKDVKGSKLLAAAMPKLLFGAETGGLGFLAEAFFYATTSTVGEYISRYLTSRQALVIFPLRLNGKELSAGLNGHMGCVAGDKISNMDSMISVLTNSQFGEKHYGSLGAVIPFIADFIFPGIDGSNLYENDFHEEDITSNLGLTSTDAGKFIPVPRYLAAIKARSAQYLKGVTSADQKANSGLPLQTTPGGTPKIVDISSRSGPNWSITVRALSGYSAARTNQHLFDDLVRLAEANSLHLAIGSAYRSPKHPVEAKKRKKPGHTHTGGRHTAGEAVDIYQINGLHLGSPGWEAMANSFVKMLESIGYTWVTPYGPNSPIASRKRLRFGNSEHYAVSEGAQPRSIIFGRIDHMDHVHVSRAD